jgi:hypothetical protein
MLCSDSKDPALDLHQCPGPSVLDAGVDLGIDKDPGNPALFTGNGPDQGAREQGVTVTYGNQPSVCP